MKNQEQYQLLMDEIVRSKPDLAKVKKAARALGLKAQGGLVEVMTEVLDFIDRGPGKRRKNPEVDL